MRAFLSDGVTTGARREGPGIGGLTTAPEVSLRAVIEPWLGAGQGAHVVLCGMAGSRNGVVEVPYVELPATADRWLSGTKSQRAQDLELSVAAGLQGTNLLGAPDVMRGEETQIFGALRLDPSLSTGRQLFVLPGTHSKWVEVSDGAITRFQTVLTGELYALLRDHSTLLRAHASDGGPEDGFAAGLARSQAATPGLQAALFEARSAQLILGRSRDWALEFLSGLLIGCEVSEMSAAFGTIADVTLIGDSRLRPLYRRVLSGRGVRTRELDGDECAVRGLLAVARCA